MSAFTKLSPPLLTLVLIGVGAALAYGAFVATRAPAGEVVLGGDVAVASNGEAFELKEHLAAGKYTIFDYYADWCPPCRALDPQLRRLAADRPDVALRKVDIVDWTTDVVKQHSITALPYLEVYDPEGRLLASGDEVYGVLKDLFDVEIF